MSSFFLFELNKKWKKGANYFIYYRKASCSEAKKHFNYRPADTDAHWKEHDSAKQASFYGCFNPLLCISTTGWHRFWSSIVNFFFLSKTFDEEVPREKTALRKDCSVRNYLSPLWYFCFEIWMREVPCFLPLFCSILRALKLIMRILFRHDAFHTPSSRSKVMQIWIRR